MHPNKFGKYFVLPEKSFFSRGGQHVNYAFTSQIHM